MKKMIPGLIALMALLVAGCVGDNPTEGARAGQEDAAAKIVAGALGYESNGLAAMADDIVTAGNGGRLRDRISDHTALVVTRNDSTFDSASMSHSLLLACQRNRGDAYSEWQIRYTINHPGPDVPAGTVAAQAHAEGTYRNSILTVQGESHGDIGLVKPAGGESAWLSGQYRWQGETIFRTEGESYRDVTVTFAWNRLHVKSGGEGTGPVLVGRCGLTITGNGPHGAFSRNGSLTFDGGDQALVEIGGKRYLVSVRSPEIIRGA